ncbi:MAG: M56 family metallopeptidase [Flavobacteriaceae bacterium]|nr:M56 family metallopeptidase [Flavobacteriaceae bacterium]
MEYLIKSTALLSMFYLFYKLFVQYETFFVAIRTFFWTGIISSLILPLITIKRYIKTEALPVPHYSPVANLTISEQPAFSVMDYLLIIYLAGLFLFFMRFLFQIFSVLRFIKSYPRQKKSDHILVLANTNASPFSFFKYIVLGKHTFEKEELEQIIAHEQIHVNQNHSLDILLSKLIAILFWFNPLAWLYQKEVQKNLEFIADENTVKKTNKIEAYPYLLLKSLNRMPQFELTSNFYQSLIKTRITMLHKTRSKKMNQWKFLAMLPILVAFIFTFNTETVAQAKPQIPYFSSQTELEAEIITKDFQKNDLESLKTRLQAKGIALKFGKLKYNSAKEITSIDISVSSKSGSKANVSQNSKLPINPIEITYDDAGKLAVGNLGNLVVGDFVFVSKDSENAQVTIGKDGTKKVIIMSTEGMEGLGYLADEITVTGLVDGQKIENKTIKIMQGGDEAMFWIGEKGDSTKLKTINVKTISDDQGGSYKITIEKDGKTPEDVIIATGAKSEKKMVFISDEGEKPVIFVDGKEASEKSLKDINPDTIEKMEVFKGQDAIDKYGEKGKNGVIMITTKK